MRLKYLGARGIAEQICLCIDRARRRFTNVATGRILLITACPKSSDIDPTVMSKLEFYGLGRQPTAVDVAATIRVSDLVRYETVLIIGPRQRLSFPLRIAKAGKLGVFDCDAATNPLEAWSWSDFSFRWRSLFDSLPERWSEVVEKLRREGKQCCYAFGTGPSLDRVRERAWSDGYRVVCNTICKSSATWHHLQPHVMVAADAIYHFGPGQYARAFRDALRARLAEHPCWFVFPARHWPLVRAEFDRFEEWLVPVPFAGTSSVHASLRDFGGLPRNVGNALLITLLPVAFALSQDVRLFGFDGRAPKDAGFWKTSGEHNFEELIPKLRELHPAFFESQIPNADPDKYIRTHLGDKLEAALQAAERAGYRITSLHPSFTEAINRRYVRPADPHLPVPSTSDFKWSASKP